jgi:Cu-Zn family superoxide dismutase
MRTSLLPLLSAAALAALMSGPALAEDKVEIPMNLISNKGIGKSIGTIAAQDTQNGFLSLKMDLTDDLPPGGHGLHIHENPSCDPAQKDGAMVAGLAAGGHYDPAGTGKHLGPSGDGHLGDLPILFVGIDEDGATATTHTLVAPRLKLADIRGRSIMVHANSDNFRDDPMPLGGGGARIACGVIP